MNLTHLRYIVEVARTGSITKAAQNLYMGQPNLSKSIKDLEKSVGTAIFMRTPKGVVPTKKGEEIIEYAKNLVKQADEFDEKFLEGRTEIKSFTVAANGIDYCHNAFEHFAAEYEQEREFSVSYRLCTSEQVFALVESGEADIGVIRVLENEGDNAPSEYKGFKFQLIGRGEERILFNEGDPNLEGDAVFPDKLEGYTEISLYGEVRGGKSVGVYDLNSGCRIVSALNKAFMRISSLDTNIPAGFAAVKSGENRVYCDYMVFSEDSRLTGVEREFFRCLREEI
ncbi:MAG: LysR family transcriptional regulator [Ruminococcaceae bacterium]|nr:LysR family transcriptional regulator [Oscillospiraceae bacterium]